MCPVKKNGSCQRKLVPVKRKWVQSNENGSSQKMGPVKTENVSSQNNGSSQKKKGLVKKKMAQ